MSLGVAYNVWDCEELLPHSIACVRDAGASYVCVVYQIMSNFGNLARPLLKHVLEEMRDNGLINELIEYIPDPKMTTEQKKRCISPRNQSIKSPEHIDMQFFHEVRKREIGRLHLRSSGCKFGLYLDADEFFDSTQLKRALKFFDKYDFQGSACRMRTYFKRANVELLPPDEINWCPVLFKIDHPIHLMAPYPILLDPTRRPDSVVDLHLFEPDELVMHHMSFVRIDMARKLNNVSNRGNMSHVKSFLKEFETWKCGDPVIHPHPTMKQQFSRTKITEMTFNIPDMSTMCALCCVHAATIKCDGCGKRYCCDAHKMMDWDKFGHAKMCRK